MLIHTKLRRAIEETIFELEKELRQSQSEKITEIANLWVEWNARKRSSSEVMYRIEKVLKDEVDWAWKEFIKTKLEIIEVKKEEIDG